MIAEFVVALNDLIYYKTNTPFFKYLQISSQLEKIELCVTSSRVSMDTFFLRKLSAYRSLSKNNSVT